MPTIRALRERFSQVADAEIQRALDQLSRKELTRDQQRDLLEKTMRLIVNKLLHQPTTVLRGADPQEALELATAVCELFDLEPTEATEATEATEVTEASAAAEGVAEPSVAEQADDTGEQKKAQA